VRAATIRLFLADASDATIAAALPAGSVRALILGLKDGPLEALFGLEPEVAAALAEPATKPRKARAPKTPPAAPTSRVIDGSETIPTATELPAGAKPCVLDILGSIPAGGDRTAAQIASHLGIAVGEVRTRADDMVRRDLLEQVKSAYRFGARVRDAVIVDGHITDEWRSPAHLAAHSGFGTSEAAQLRARMAGCFLRDERRNVDARGVAGDPSGVEFRRGTGTSADEQDDDQGEEG
jgi:hypothetical protein